MSTLIQILSLAGIFEQAKRMRVTPHLLGNDPLNTEALKAPNASKTVAERVIEAQRASQSSRPPPLDKQGLKKKNSIKYILIMD